MNTLIMISRKLFSYTRETNCLVINFIWFLIEQAFSQWTLFITCYSRKSKNCGTQLLIVWNMHIIAWKVWLNVCCRNNAGDSRDCQLIWRKKSRNCFPIRRKKPELSLRIFQKVRLGICSQTTIKISTNFWVILFKKTM